MDFFLAMVLKPFVALGLLTLVWLIAYVIWKKMPDSPLKRRLFSPLPGHKRRWH